MTLEAMLLLIIVFQLGGILFRVGQIRDNIPEHKDGYQPKGPRLVAKS
jgi:hypothetical protein